MQRHLAPKVAAPALLALLAPKVVAPVLLAPKVSSCAPGAEGCSPCAPGAEGADPGGALGTPVLAVGALVRMLIPTPGFAATEFLVYFRCRQPVSLRDSGVEL
jgi:hypothetical protein